MATAKISSAMCHRTEAAQQAFAAVGGACYRAPPRLKRSSLDRTRVKRMGIGQTRLPRLWRTAIIAVSVATGASHLRAECVGLSMSNNKRFADLVFSGTVTGLQQLDDRHAVVTVDVDRVWKGTVGRHVVLYGIHDSIDSYAFSVGTEYLVFAKRLMPEQRVGFSFGEREIAFGVPTCGGGTQPLERVGRE